MRVMPDIVKVVAVFIIAGIVALDIVNPLLKLGFLCGVVVFRCHKVAVLRRVRRSKNAVHHAGEHSPAGRKSRRYHDE